MKHSIVNKRVKLKCVALVTQVIEIKIKSFLILRLKDFLLKFSGVALSDAVSPQ